MAVSETDIVNQALLMLGCSPIQSLNTSNNQGVSATVFYYSSRDALLREIPWSFARKQVALNQLAAVPVTLDLLPNTTGPGNIVWTGAFGLPNDFLRMYRFSPQNAHWRLISIVNNNVTQLCVITDAVP